MSNESTLIGTVSPQEPVLCYTHNDERFFSVDVHFKDIVLPVLYSEYNKPDSLNGVFKIKGTLVSDLSGGIPKFYFYSYSFEAAEPDSDPTNVVTVTAHVNKGGKLTLDRNNHDQLPITLNTRWILGGRSLIYLILKDGLARKYKSIARGTIVTVTGKIVPYKDVFELEVTEMTSIKE